MEIKDLSESAKDKKIALLLEDLSFLESYVNDIFNFFPLPICFVSPSGIILESNAAFKKFSGFTFDEIIGKAIENLFEKKEINKILRKSKVKEFIQGIEIDFLANHNKKLAVQVFTKTRKDESGKFLGSFLGFSDLTEIKRKDRKSRKALMDVLEDVKKARKKAEEEKNRTLSIINNFTDGILVLDEKSNFFLINPKAKEFLEIKEKSMIGKSVLKLATLKPLAELLNKKGKEIFRQNLKIRESLILEITAVPAIIKKKRTGTLVILHDVTREELVDKMKTEFVSLAAHQLRTPLSAVKWILKMLLDGELGRVNEEQKEFLKDGYVSNQRMINLVNDLLNVARIEEGRYVYDLILTDLRKLINPIIIFYKKECKEKKINFIFKDLTKKTHKVLVDREKIRIAFENIVDNAVRYTFSGGKVTISLKCSTKEIEVCVKDTGMGIPQGQEKRIFSKFFRGTNVAKKETEGSGLGLFISKNIINAHGGKIWFKSQENKGTAFYFTIPIKRK